jgi:hypothetical protein
MKILVSIFGTAKSISPDMQATVSLTESMSNGKWTNGIGDFKYVLNNELIDEIDESRLVDRIKEKIYALVNSPIAYKWVKTPTLRVYYNPEDSTGITVRSQFDLG